MRVPIYEHGENRGVLYTEQKGLYTVFRAEVSTQEVSKVHAVFEGGEIALGVPAPEQEKMVLRISVPTSRLPRGMLLHGLLLKKQDGWNRFPGGQVGTLTLPSGRRQEDRYQFPWKPGQRLPCDAVMCFFCYVAEGYLEIQLDQQGRPKV